MALVVEWSYTIQVSMMQDAAQQHYFLMYEALEQANHGLHLEQSVS